MPPYSAVTKFQLPVAENNLPIILPKQNYTILENHKNKCNSFWNLWGTFESDLIWFNIIALSLVNVVGIIGLLTYPYSSKTNTLLFNVFYGACGGFGVTAGAHRLWCHRSYKATVPFRIILIVCYAIAGQNKLYDWVRDHRVHHKYSETEADPHNSNRGFFFAHMGWLMMKKHAEVLRKGRKINCNDLLEDPVLVFHDTYFYTMKVIFCFLIPIIVPHYFWNETWYWCIVSGAFSRYCLNLHCTWSVNSVAHMFGIKPYDKNIQPVESLSVSLVAMGEGWHNYHHTFPWDYKAAEWGNWFNVTTFYLDLFAKIGWVYDRKTASNDLIKKTVMKNGDGTHTEWKYEIQDCVGNTLKSE